MPQVFKKWGFCFEDILIIIELLPNSTMTLVIHL